MVELFKMIIDELKSDLGDGLVTADIWHSKDGQSMAGFNSNPKAVALLNEVTSVLGKTIKQSDYPALDDYYTAHLEDNLLILVIISGDYQLGMLVDLSKTTMGVLMNISLHKMLDGFKEATS